MIPTKKNPKWKALVKGEIEITFNLIAGNMLLHRLTRSTKRDGSDSNIQKCIDEAYNYFAKFESAFSQELNRIFN